MNVSKITIYSAAAKANIGALPFRGDVAGNSKTKASEMLESFTKPVTDYEVTHLDLPKYAKPEKGRFTGRLKRDAEFDAMSTNSSFDRFEKSNDAADIVTRYTLQQIKDGNASVNSTLNYKGVDSTKEIGAAFRNGISVSLKYNLISCDRPNVVTVTARSGDTQEILLYDNGLERSQRAKKLIEVLKLV